MTFLRWRLYPEVNCMISSEVCAMSALLLQPLKHRILRILVELNRDLCPEIIG